LTLVWSTQAVLSALPLPLPDKSLGELAYAAVAGEFVRPYIVGLFSACSSSLLPLREAYAAVAGEFVRTL
jgi:hypothetical protein